MPHNPTSLFARVAAPLCDGYAGYYRSLGRLLLRYARRHDLDDDALAEVLGCRASLLPELAACRNGGERLDFHGIASRFGLSREALEMIERDDQEDEDRGRASRQAAARTAAGDAWRWFLDFVGRVPELRESPRAMTFLRRCADRRRRGSVSSPRGTAWYRALPRHRGRDLIDIARGP
jgi:hypothetical protein